MKTIAIYFSDPEPMGYPFNKEYFGLYQEVIRDIRQHDIAVYIVRGSSYEGKGVFSHGWYFENGKLTEHDKKIKADLIFNRDDKSTIPKIYDCPIINHPDFDLLCLDKYLTVQQFPDISPHTDLLNSYEDFLAKAKEYSLAPETRIVLKKNFLTEGRGVFIVTTNEVHKALYEDWHDVLLQKFLDAQIGIPGIVTGNHDLRIEVINGEASHASVRIPKEGSFLANVAQGGTMRTVPLSKLPPEVLDIVQGIQKKVDHYRPLLYSADFMNTEKGFKLVELNSRPGLLDKDEAQYEEWNGKIANMLIETILNEKL
ncbi:MAG: hypothetical protein WCW16_00935 [Candidatus Magasanikbacteria bacterium]